MEVILETARTYLREMNDDDFDALKKIIHNHDGSECNDAYVHKWLKWCKDSYNKDGFGHWAVIYKETGEMIGSCGVSMQLIDNEWKPEIGYHIRSDYQRKGLATEISRAIKDWFFKNTRFDEVCSYMYIDNIPSYKTAEANGMKFVKFCVDKEEKNCRVYKITREEWNK